MSTCSAASRSHDASHLRRTIAACVAACLVSLLPLAGCAGAQQKESGPGEQAAPLEETPFIQARYGFPGVSNAIVLDGTIELVTVEMDAAATDAADDATAGAEEAAEVEKAAEAEEAAEADAAAEAEDAAEADAAADEASDEQQTESFYVLRLDQKTDFSMLYSAAGLHEDKASTDAVVLYSGNHDSDPAKQGVEIDDQLWGSLVGRHLSVHGELWVGYDEAVGLEYPLAADPGCLAQQIGVTPGALGMEGAEDYDKEGYSWQQLSELANVMAATKNRDYGFRIANAYGLLTGNNDVKTIDMGDNSCTMRLVDVMADVTTDDGGEERYVGMTFVSADTPFESAFDTPAEDSTRVSYDGSQLATWLDNDVYGQLPQELQDLVTPVNKACTVVENAPAVPTVETSAHKLWVPSVVELGGAPEWGFGSAWLDAEGIMASNAALAQEESKTHGTSSAKKYLYYYRNDVSSDDIANDTLVLHGSEDEEGHSWWTRTVDPCGNPHYVYVDGSLQNADASAETSLRVVFGFCLG